MTSLWQAQEFPGELPGAHRRTDTAIRTKPALSGRCSPDNDELCGDAVALPDAPGFDRFQVAGANPRTRLVVES